MSKRVVICSDSTTDLGAELIAKYDIKTVPLSVNLGGKAYTDGLDIDPDMIYRHYEAHGELPKTAAPNIAAFCNFFEEQTANGCAVVLFTISAEMSSTYNNARLAAANYPDVYVVDTRNLSTGGGLLVVAAAQMAQSGMSAGEIARECASLTDCVDASFVIDNLEFLHKGGRCSAVAALAAGVLQLKPCITVRGGKMGVAKKYRGKFARVLQTYIADRIGDAANIDLSRVFVTHAGCDEEIVAACVAQVKAAAPWGEVHVTRAGCTVSSHCGRNTLGVLFLRKK
ncbi:MAG: DegV family protein [Clostridia bacterium]|nr:DegV family protein [Clostridia bacterium]MBR3862677.1 DegV family protein [Clostridia bacterium]